MNRVVIVCAVAVALIAAGVVYHRQRPVQSDDAPAAAAPQPAPAPQEQPGQTASAPEPPPPAAVPEPRRPSFDAVRVDESGAAVIAGSAAPNADVVILDGEKELGRVTADGRGDFVFIPERPLGPGSRRLGLRAEGTDGEPLESEDVVVLVVPEPNRDIAGQAAGGDADRQRPLALLVPRDEEGATQVLQAPAAPMPSAPTPVEEPAPDAAPVQQAAAPEVLPPAPADPQPTERQPPEQPAAAQEPAKPAVSIDVVDYDEKGELVVTGRAAPQAEVRLYLDNDLVGTGTADAAGDYAVQPQQSVDVGTYRMRVDQVDEGGEVVARAETPFSRADPATLAPGPGQVVVQPGNSLWRIARRIYGEGPRYTVIYQANQGQIRDPDLIYPGQIFSLPELEEPPADPG